MMTPGGVGTPCASPMWTATTDVNDFMARHGVERLAPRLPEQVVQGTLSLRVKRQACVGNLRAAVQLEEELRKQEGVIAAEAVARGMSYRVIGHALSVGKSAAHKSVFRILGE